MISQLRPALVMLGAFTVLLGLGYPLAMTGIAQVTMPRQAGGSLVERDGAIVGSVLIGQAFTRPEYLHSRPSATDPAYNAGSSTGSNLGPSSAALLAQVRERAAAQGPGPVPSEMATASASGLDPHITLDAALRQVDRIAAARGVPPAAVEDAIRGATTGPAFGLLGEPIVNVLAANLALDAQEG
ncbi:potassium-transporting ATPase subunit KdpC [Paracoccus benzoatiresistens]|uniref:Potassium-transporting ATPase KdpC subunit n=1 Tax=Paracoccus benzoatiresistens TaxID=2997341 RepID=A0ABT4J704_9RHOB|nr:potassium-transporting ATPase subunit KdpC [Paracoccus sp. EF6]MCZ0962913.1 potassium-transporting ATPase subunit KdpC [Paracoccus sp. EF6]